MSNDANRQPLATMPAVNVNFGLGGFTGESGGLQEGLVDVTVDNVAYVPPKDSYPANLTFHVHGIGKQPRFLYVQVPSDPNHKDYAIHQRAFITFLQATGVVAEDYAQPAAIDGNWLAAQFANARPAKAYTYPSTRKADGSWANDDYTELLTPARAMKIADEIAAVGGDLEKVTSKPKRYVKGGGKVEQSALGQPAGTTIGALPTPSLPGGLPTPATPVVAGPGPTVPVLPKPPAGMPPLPAPR